MMCSSFLLLLMILELIFKEILSQSYFELTNYQILYQYLPPHYSNSNQTLHILDIGAHDTKWAQTMQQLLGNYRTEFFQIEGNNDHRNSLELFGHYYIIALVGDVDDEIVTFYKSNYQEYTTGNSIFKEISNIYQENTIIEKRPMYRLDSILSLAQYDEVFDIVKYDIQGSEKKGLLGSESTLKKMNEGIIIIESALLPVNGGNAASLLDIQDILNSFGFTLVDVLAEHYLVTSTGCQLVQIDAIYQKTSYSLLNNEQEEYSWPPKPF